eukprot:TRINITY_DN87758_c0_g1_i1.p1 TRINITY_DN87758_c0_g1~~TRINITY_DN87758_c0_g1_i1.p1  ORF type:complete len:139 (-),score=30.89 TRINITY_DN87758_c0_g1_i1:20-415(-)
MGNAGCCESSDADGESLETIKALPISSDSPFSEVEEKSTTGSAEGGGVVFSFQLQDGSMKDITFTAAPLGVVFSQQSPFVVKKVHAGKVADANGVEIGWTLVRVDGEVVPTGLADCQELTKRKLAAVAKKE